MKALMIGLTAFAALSASAADRTKLFYDFDAKLAAAPRCYTDDFTK